MPIDWFIDDVDGMLAARSDARGVHHHTTDGSPTIQHVGELLAELLGLPGFDVSLAHGLATSPLERALSRRTAFYGAYLSASKRFERSRPLGRTLSREDVREYLASALGQSQVVALPAPRVTPLQRAAR